jgi:SAM-dependent methyltransferase
VKGYEPMMSFNEEAAETYDEYHRRGDEGLAAEFLAGLAETGPALELAIGTGRIALPLAAKGVRVDGIDLSPSMIAQLRAKPGGDQLSVTLGDFSEVPVSGRYRLIFIVFNTLFNLLTQDEQVRCFENVAAHLQEDGVFVVEAFNPARYYRLNQNQYVNAESIGVAELTLDVARHDPVEQHLIETHVRLSREHGVRLFPIVCRYAWPSELDLMARIAGLRLRERWSDWERQPFGPQSEAHISVYGR